MANEFFKNIQTGLSDALAYERGDTKRAHSSAVTVAALPAYSASQIKDIRTNLSLTQKMFAYVIGVSEKTVEAWEAGRNTPQGPAQRFLSVLDSGGRDFLRQYGMIDR